MLTNSSSAKPIIFKEQSVEFQNAGQYSTSITNVVFFIGGGGDKTRERFGFVKWGPTRLMEFAKTLFEQHQGPCSRTEYYGYLDKKAIIKKIVKLRRKDPLLRINIVGHSRGGSVAKEIATKNLRKKKIPVNLLITLDPVKAKLQHKYKIPNKKGINNVDKFVNIFAQPTRRKGADYVALIGGQYGVRLKKRAHDFVQVNVGHGQPQPLLMAPINELGQSALDLLIKESFT